METWVLDGIVVERMVEPKLNFFLIGAPKAGTTMLHARLSRHAQVYLSPLKEPNRYSTDIDPTTFSAAFKANTPSDLSAYFSHRPLASRQVAFVRDPEQYAALFEAATPSHRVVGECSTSYLHSKAAPQQVARAFPDARILVALRNPVERAHSHWRMARKYGFTSLGFLEAVAKDQAHPQPGWGRSELFVASGLYTEALKRWHSLFPEGQLKVVLSESLRREETMSDIQDWLGISGELPLVDAEEGNPAGRARLERLNHWATHSGVKAAASKWLPKGVKLAVAKRWYTTDGLPPLSEEERYAVFPHFADDIDALEQWLDVDLRHWRPQGGR